MEFLLGYAAGLLTLINPCVLPVLPIVLASAMQANRLGPVVLAAGMSLSFVLLGVLVTAFGHLVGLTPEGVAKAGAVVMAAFGVVLLVPSFSARFATATAGLSARADAGMDEIDRGGLQGQFLGGLVLGAVWSPCIGPTLGGAIALASQGESLGRAAAIMATFSLGVSTALMALAYGTRTVIQRRQAAMRGVAGWARPVMGLVFLAVGLGLYFEVQHAIEAWALQTLPAWLIDFSVSI